MSSQAGNTKLASDDPSIGGLDSTRISTNQQGVVLRYFCGIGRFAVTWLGPAYNQKVKNVSSASGKAAGATTGHKYYADCAGLLNVGLTDGIREIWMQNSKVWSGTLNRNSGEDSAQITIDGKGTMRIYWGTETQPIDPILAPHDHPAYRGQCYLVFKQLYFGRDTTTAPNIEVVIVRQAKDHGLAAAATLNDDSTPPHAMIELLTNPRFGLGWTAADTLVLDTWDATAQQCLDEGFAITPNLDRDEDARALLIEFCDYFDGYVVADPTHGGKLALKLARPFSGNTDALPLFTEADLLDVPNPSCQNWRETFNEFSVRYTDQESDFQDNSTLFVDPSNRRVVGEPINTSLERPWITKTALAMQLAAYAARLQSVPWLTIKDLPVRKAAAVGIGIGNFVLLSYADYQNTLLLRVRSRKVEADRSQQVMLELRAEGFFNDVLPYVAGAAPVLVVPALPPGTYVPVVPPKADAPVIAPQPPDYVRLLEPPRGLLSADADSTVPQVAALVSRTGGLDTGFQVLSSPDGTDYAVDAVVPRFCVHGTLAAALVATHSLDDGTDGILIDCAGLDDALDLETTSEVGRLVASLLVFVDNEIIGYRDVQLVSPTQARLVGLRRGCFDTLVAAHALGADVAIIAQGDLAPWTDPTYAAAAAVHLKVITATALAVLDPADVADNVLTLTARSTRPLPPMNLRVNGQGVAPSYNGSGDVLIEWDPTSWDRHAFWNSWDGAFNDGQMSYVLRIVATGGALVRKVPVGVGVTSYTYPAATLLADFGGTLPASWRVQVYARVGGVRSQTPIAQVITSTSGTGTNPAPRTNWMSRSGMSQILSACDPETLTDRNFSLVAARFSLSLPATAGQDQDGAPAAVQANFDAIASALSLTLYPVANSRDPEIATQANFEMINDAW